MKTLKEALFNKKNMDKSSRTSPYNHKYEFTGETMNYLGHTLYRIKSLKNLSDYEVYKGDLGGWIESEDNLSFEKDSECWVFDNAMVFDNATVSEYAIVFEDAKVYGDSKISGTAQVHNKAEVYGNANLSDEVTVYEYAKVYGYAEVYGEAEIYGNAKVYGDAEIYGTAEIHGTAEVFGKSEIQSINIDSGKIKDKKLP